MIQETRRVQSMDEVRRLFDSHQYERAFAMYVRLKGEKNVRLLNVQTGMMKEILFRFFFPKGLPDRRFS